MRVRRFQLGCVRAAEPTGKSEGMLPLSYGLEIVQFLEPRSADHEFR